MNIEPPVTISEMVKELKGGSSHDANSQLQQKLLYWQRGYGVVSFGKSNLVAAKGSGVFFGQIAMIMACRLAEKDSRPRKVRGPFRWCGLDFPCRIAELGSTEQLLSHR